MSDPKVPTKRVLNLQDLAPGLNFQARMKPSSENENIKRDRQQGPLFWGIPKVQTVMLSEIESFKPE